MAVKGTELFLHFPHFILVHVLIWMRFCRARMLRGRRHSRAAETLEGPRESRTQEGRPGRGDDKSWTRFGCEKRSVFIPTLKGVLPLPEASPPCTKQNQPFTGDAKLVHALFADSGITLNCRGLDSKMQVLPSEIEPEGLFNGKKAFARPTEGTRPHEKEKNDTRYSDGPAQQVQD